LCYPDWLNNMFCGKHIFLQFLAIGLESVYLSSACRLLPNRTSRPLRLHTILGSSINVFNAMGGILSPITSSILLLTLTANFLAYGVPCAPELTIYYSLFSTLFLNASYAISQSGHIATERFMSNSVFAYNFAISIVSFR
jgi:hypothetical protein